MQDTRGERPRQPDSLCPPTVSHQAVAATIGTRRGIARLFLLTVRDRPWTRAGRAVPPFGAARRSSGLAARAVPNWLFCRADGVLAGHRATAAVDRPGARTVALARCGAHYPLT